VLREILTVPKGDVLAQIKRVSGLRVEEADYSQSGHCRMKTPNGELDLRVSTFPGIAGERVAISILDKDTIRLTLDQLGVSGRVLSEFRRVLELRQGFVLVAGASGSGRTTTLYAALTHLNTANRNILTIEDPVEYVIPGITQGLVNPATGITFASGLRSILRQDADVILVGDLRDRETGQLALESSHSRRLVLSAIDSQDCATSIGHLLGMGIDPTLVAGSVPAVMAQRLISSNCPHCLRTYSPHPDLLNRHGLPVEHEYLRGEGCDACSNTGLLGRIAVFEFFELNPKTRKMILAGKSIGDIRDHMVERGMRTLDQEAASLVLAGRLCVEVLSQ
jgi:type II secretory ATPase GspE/PulE/Tfp pilus assembly ATPase PilB-like protein